MTLFLINLILAFIWAALTADFKAENMVLGFLIAFLILGITSKIWGKKSYNRKVWNIIKFIGFLIEEMIISNVKVAIDVLRPRIRNTPGVIKIPLDVESDLEITLIANIISLTPGTLTLDISNDKRFLFVHTMFAEDIPKQRHFLKNAIEKPIARICQ